MLLPLELPPGMARNGTDYQNSGRWIDGSLVRWREGKMQPVGGWTERTASTTAAAPRGMHTWQDNSADRWVALGTLDTLYVLNEAGTLFDITPVGLTSGIETALIQKGFGSGLFGSGLYGSARIGTTWQDATSWSLVNWGEYLIAANADDGKIYEWQNDTGTVAAVITNAPTSCMGAAVTAERFLFALGAGGNPRRLEWSDREDNSTWTPAATNEAGGFELDTAGRLMCAVSTRSQTLFLTDVDAHVASYVGPPFVYGFARVGTSCGAISRKASAAIDGGAIWMGYRNFFKYVGGTVEPVQCDVLDYVFTQLNRGQQSLVHSVVNAQFGEVWWYYPSTTNECDKYVVYNYRENHWATGDIDRTAGVDRGVFEGPIWVSSTGVIYDHETDNEYGGAEVFAESGPISLGSGDQVMSINQLVPDEDTQGDCVVKLKTRFYPNDTEREYGPYTMSAPTDVRVTGRQVRLRVTGSELNDWRWGTVRANAIARGRR